MARAVTPGVSGRRSGRALMIFAAGFLLLDAVLLAMAGVWLARPALLVWGVLLAAGAVGVTLLWRRYLVQLGELDEARAALRREIRRISRTIQGARN